MPDGTMMVSVLCATYNQENYIRQCLDSVLAQETDFRFEVIVRDDCSTDNTTKLVLEYAEKYPDKVIPLILEENHYSHGKNDLAFIKLFSLIRGRYFAICEGMTSGRIRRNCRPRWISWKRIPNTACAAMPHT